MMLNRAEFRAAGLQGRSTSTEVFEPLNWFERLKDRMPKWMRLRARMRSIGWRGLRRGSFLSMVPTISHRRAAQRAAHAKIERHVIGGRVRSRGRTRRKRAEQRQRARSGTSVEGGA